MECCVYGSKISSKEDNWIQFNSFDEIKQVAENENDVYCLVKDGTLFKTMKNNAQWISVMKQVTQIYSSEIHNIWLTNQGEIFTFGNNKSGQLGLGDCMDRNEPHKVSLNNIKSLCGGTSKYHSACVSVNGEVFSWGDAKYGKLGYLSDSDQLTPKMISTWDSEFVPPVITSVVVGTECTMFLSTNDLVYTCGHGSLGHDDSLDRCVPKLVQALLNTSIKQIAISDTACFVLTKGGRLASWGSGIMLGVGCDRMEKLPYWNKKLAKYKVKSISACTTHVGIVTADQAFVWGNNDSSAMGLPPSTLKEQYIPVKMSFNPTERITVDSSNKPKIICTPGLSLVTLPISIVDSVNVEDVKPFDLVTEKSNIWITVPIFLIIIVAFIIYRLFN